MPKFEAWDICWAYVKYEEIDEEKRRPVILLKDGSALVVGLYVTSKPPRPGYNDYPLVDWEKEGLPVRSTVRLEKRLRIPKDKILSKIGKVTQRDKILLAHKGDINLL